MRNSSSLEPIAVVVDDDDLMRLIACEILDGHGFHCLGAPSADMALVLLETNASAVVLLFTDVQMPGQLDGFALARAASMQWPDIGIVVASGQQSPRAGDLPPGARFVSKPFSADAVLEHLLEIVPQHRQPPALKRHGDPSAGSGGENGAQG